MSGNRLARHTLKSAGKARLTTIRDILREIEEDEARERAQNANSKSNEFIGSHAGSPRSQNSTDSGISGTTGRRIVVRVPTAGATKTNRKAREKSSRCALDKTNETISKKTARQSDSKSKGNETIDKTTNSFTRFADSPEHIEDSDSNNNPSYDDVWDNFEDEGIHFLPKLMTERGSVPFHKCMDEMKNELKTLKRKQRREGIKAAIKMTMMLNKSVGGCRSGDRVDGETDSDDYDTSGEDTESEEEPKPRSFGKMSRGWRLLNMALKEQHLQKKKEEGPDAWNLLSHTINQMTNEEKARQELYEKYIYKPNSWAEGFVNPPKFLQEKLSGVSSSISGGKRSQGGAIHRPQTAHARIHIHHRAAPDKDSCRNNDIVCRTEFKNSKYTHLNRPKSGLV